MLAAPAILLLPRGLQAQIPVTGAGGSGPGGGVAPLDGLSNVTAAFSTSRKLLSTYNGAFYTVSSGIILSLVKNQVSGANDMQANGGAVTIVNSGPNSKAAVIFAGVAGSNCTTVGLQAVSNWLTVSNAYIVCAAQPTTFPSNSGQSQDCQLCADVNTNGLYFGMYLRNNNTYTAFNWDGNGDVATTAITTNTPYIFEWWHTGGSVFSRINGVGSGTSTASGNTQSMTNAACWGGNVATQPLVSGSAIFECVYFNATPNSTIRDALVANMKTWIGA